MPQRDDKKDILEKGNTQLNSSGYRKYSPVNYSPQNTLHKHFFIFYNATNNAQVA